MSDEQELPPTDQVTGEPVDRERQPITEAEIAAGYTLPPELIASDKRRFYRGRG